MQMYICIYDLWLHYEFSIAKDISFVLLSCCTQTSEGQILSLHHLVAEIIVVIPRLR